MDTVLNLFIYTASQLKNHV